MLDVYVGQQSLVFGFEPFKLPRIFDRNGRDARDCSNQFQMIVIELVARERGIEVSDIQYRSRAKSREAV